MNPEQLFYFGVAMESFRPNKAARIQGIELLHGRVVFHLVYADGVADFAEVFDSRDLYELLTYEQGEKKHGAEAFE